MISTVLRVIGTAFSSATIAITLFALSSVAYAQEALSVEELEALLERKKAALDGSIEEREVTAEKQREIVGLLAIQDAENEEIEEELRILCKEHDEVESGSLEECLVDMGLTPE